MIHYSAAGMPTHGTLVPPPCPIQRGERAYAGIKAELQELGRTTQPALAALPLP